MRTDLFNPATYQVIDIVTGSIIPVQLFIEEASKDYWEKAYAKTLAEYIGVGGSNNCKVLAYILKEKTNKNLLNGTIRSIANDLSISTSPVTRMFSILQKRDMIRKVRNGCYFVSPSIMVHGSKTQGAMLLRLWNMTDECSELSCELQTV